MNEPPILCKGVHLFARSITDPSLTIRLPYEPDSSVLLLAVAAGAVGLGSAILTLETNGLVDEEVTHARVGGRRDGKGNDDTCINVRDRPCHRRWIAGADRGGSTREESCEGASGVARRYELFQWTRRQHDLGPDVFEGLSRRRAMVGVCRRRSMAHVPACSSFCTDTKHRQSVTDAIDGISAGNGAATTDRTNIPARGSSGAPLGGTPAGQLAWETCWPRCGVESGVVVEKSPAQGRSIEARELLKERACTCNSSDMEWLISGWALELGCRMNGVLLANCSHSHQPTGLANKPKTCLRPSHFAHPVRVIGWREATGRRARTALATTSPQSSRITHSPPSRPRLEPLSRHHP